MKYTVSLVTAFALGTIAQDCKTAQETIVVSSPEDLDIFRDDCTTITGNIEISPNYIDDFTLESVTDIIGNISIPDDASPGTLGAVNLPDLVNIGAIILHQATEVNLPKLERAGDILLNPWVSGTVDLRSLCQADNIWVYDGWESVDFSSLETVHDTMDFSDPKANSLFSADQLPPLDIAFPALKSVKYLTIGGYAASFSAPELEVIGNPDAPEEDTSHDGLVFAIRNEIEVEFPKLRTLTGSTLILGGVTRISLPSLGETNAGIEFNTEGPVEIYSSIETASYLWLWGEIKSVELPNIVELGSLSLAQTIVPCNETLVRIWEALPGGPPEIESSTKRCRREDLPVENTDPESLEEEGTGNSPSQGEEAVETDTTPESNEGSEINEVEDQDGPGNTGLLLAPLRVELGVLFLAVSSYVLYA